MRGPQKQTKTLSVCFWESGGTSCPNDDRVIGPCNLVTEREVIGPCDLIVERAAAIFRTSNSNLRGSLFMSIFVAATYSPICIRDACFIAPAVLFIATMSLVSRFQIL